MVEAPVEVRITGPDAAELRTLGGKAAEILRQVPGAIYVHNDWHEASYQLRVSMREETANRLGLTNASIARQLAGGFEGAPVTTYWEGDRDVSVILRIEQERRETFEDVGDSYVTSTLTGARVPLRSVAEFEPVWSESRIVRRNGVRTLTVRAFADEHHLPSQVLKAAMGKVASLPLPPGYRIEYGGEIENQRETFAEMVHALEISLIAIFLILLFQFRSLSGPLIVMASIPLALPGAALGLFVTRNPFGFTAFMGIVSLGGVVVRNAIILIDYIHARMREGAPLEEAAKEAGERRLRPIFLTTMAAAVGVTPMILSGSSLWSPLASAIAFGLVVSMFFTLVAIPVLFVVVHRRERVRATVPVTAVLGLLLLAVLPAGAAEPRRLTLEEATALAVKQNSMVKLANFKVKEAESRVGAARSNYYPQLRNDSAFVRLGEQQEVDLPRGALGVYPGLGPIPPVTVPFVLAENNLVISSTTVTQPVTHLFKIRDGVRAANAEAGIARSDVRRAEVEIALKVKELYYGILVTGERRRALGLQIAAGEEKLREARDAVETGNALQYKVLEGEAQIAQARQGLQTLDDTLADLALEFDELLGLPLDTQVELVRPEPSSEDRGGLGTGY